MNTYEIFASVYDELMDNIPYDDWCAYIIEVLKKYQIPYDRYKNEKEILQAIEKVIPEVEPEEQEKLDQISMSIAERDYYKNTNK